MTSFLTDSCNTTAAKVLPRIFRTSCVWPVGYVEIFRYSIKEKAAETILATAKFAVESTAIKKHQKHNNQPSNVMETMAFDDDKETVGNDVTNETVTDDQIIGNGLSGAFCQKGQELLVVPTGQESTTKFTITTSIHHNKRTTTTSTSSNRPLKKHKTLDQSNWSKSSALPAEYRYILTKYKDLIRQAQEEDPLLENDPRTQEEMLRILKRWDPQTDIICLYVRWARQLPKNFHLDSIATLLCLSNQCNDTPIHFLTTVKTLHAVPSKNEYGFTIHYDSFGKLDSKGQELNQRLKGLSITLALLQANITRSNGLLGKTKMREKQGTRRPVTMHVTTGDSNHPSNASFMANPQIEFHTGKALAARMWRSVHHRWMALYVVEHLFRPKGARVWNDEKALEFSFQMFSGFGRTRYDYLDPLAGVALYFVTQDHDIEPNRQKLDDVWSDALLFVPFANSFLNSITDNEKVRIMVNAFHQLNMKTQKRYTYQPYQSFEKRWLLLRCFIFQQWLTRARNKDMKTQMEIDLKKQKSNVIVAPLLQPSKQKTIATASIAVPPHPLSTLQEQEVLANPVTTETKISNGLQSLVSSQKDVYHPVSMKAAQADKNITGLSESARAQNVVSTPSSLMDSKKKFSEKAAWTSARLVHPSAMDQLCASYLLIHREDGVVVLSRLTPLEVYSADWLCKRKHGRFGGDANYFPSSHIGPVSTLDISPQVKSFLDIASNASYQVARAGSSYMDQHGSMLPTLQECVEICRAVVTFGKQDSSRSSGQFRINLGCGGQDRRDGIPCKLHDGGFKEAISKDSSFHSTTNIPHLIGRCVEVVWRILSDMLRDSNCSPMAPDPQRDWEYARHLRQYLGIASNVAFEDVTVVVSSLYPTVDNVNIHIDHMNDNVSGYTRTGALNLCFSLGEPISNIVHLQVRRRVLGGHDHWQEFLPTLFCTSFFLKVITNFRKVIREYMLPFMPALNSTFLSVKKYLQTWQHDIDRIFGGKTSKVPTPFDRSDFFLDDVLPFKSITIFNEIQDDFILTVIGPSRTLSLSLFIEPIYLLRKRLFLDQRLELCFAASFLSNPFWFDHVLRLLIKRDGDRQDNFQFGLHPFYDWVRATQETFSGQWQGGPHNRWSPCGGGKPIPEIFGAMQTASDEQRKVGRIRLEKVVSILYKHVSWINSLVGRGDNCVQDMPLDMVRRQMELTCKAIHDIVPCQFSLFRLSIFTTLIIGCGEVATGRHLRQLMFPIKNTASYEHLMNTSVGIMSTKRASELCQNMNAAMVANDGNTKIKPESHDLAMLYLSTYLNLPKYNRDEMECALCESIPGRNLSCCDWFRKGQRLFDIDNDGILLMKEYGRNSRWEPVEIYDKLCNCAYLNPYIVFIPRNKEIIQLAKGTGEAMRASSQILFEGRCTNTSAAIQQYTNNYANLSTVLPSKFEYRVANFYCDSPRTRRTKAPSRMKVLGDSVSAKDLRTEANSLDKFPVAKFLLDHVSWLLTPRVEHDCAEKESRVKELKIPPMYAACYHQEIISHCSRFGHASYFPGHRDKAFVHQAIFVPLTKRIFYTFLAIPIDWTVYQDTDTYDAYCKWKDGLPDDEKTKITNFETGFSKEARWHMKVDVVTRIFRNELGSVLSFPANTCYHATVTPGHCEVNGKLVGRDLFIIHPLELSTT
mmetsp:Transcript_13887/g.28326  ORF Transcript_13887/g.28326 Transcript_13887/m.28326 type:complete len:1656 (-) Transcript_13887:317-5284(-)